ncbi:MAG: hypothetical protein OEY49_05530 [Candidatus Heimdallarchaeota archaeon]|nr:hypothetical protein [Candidatus Heimdallarchaeota archaeon]
MQVEEILRDLLHPSLDIRKKGFIEMKKHWNLDMRPYLWRAIETEKDKNYQAELVRYAISILEDKSMRKMIRYLEINLLANKSINEIMIAYPNLENEEIQIALLKSLQRDKSKTYQFMAKFIISNAIVEMGIERIINLLHKIFALNMIEVEKRYIFESLIGLHRYTRFQKQLVYRVMLEFGNESLIRLIILKYLKQDSLIWSFTDWKNNKLLSLSEVDFFLLESLKYRNENIRIQALQIMGSIYYRHFYYPDSPENLDLLDEICDTLLRYNKDEEFINLQNYSVSTLKELFTTPDVEESNDLLRVQLDKLLTFEIRPVEIKKLLMYHLPRKYLLYLVREDPSPKIRLHSYQLLSSSKYWIYRTNEGALIHGPISIWTDMIKRCVTALQYEDDVAIWEAVVYLFNKLLDFSLELSEEKLEVIKQILDKLRILDILKDMSDQNYVLPLIYRLSDFKSDHKLELQIDDNITESSILYLLSKKLRFVENEEDREIIKRLLKLSNVDYRKLVLIEIERFFTRVKLSNAILEILKEIIENAILDNDVRIRTFARLLLNKI